MIRRTCRTSCCPRSTPRPGAATGAGVGSELPEEQRPTAPIPFVISATVDINGEKRALERSGPGQVRAPATKSARRRRSRSGAARLSSRVQPRRNGHAVRPIGNELLNQRIKVWWRDDEKWRGRRDLCTSHFSAMTRRCWLDRAARHRTATPSSWRRVDGVEDNAAIQHERAVKF